MEALQHQPSCWIDFQKTLCLKASSCCVGSTFRSHSFTHRPRHTAGSQMLFLPHPDRERVSALVGCPGGNLEQTAGTATAC